MQDCVILIHNYSALVQNNSCAMEYNNNIIKTIGYCTGKKITIKQSSNVTNCQVPSLVPSASVISYQILQQL